MEETEVLLFEKSASMLTNLRDKAFLFPDFSPADDLVEILESKIDRDNIKLHLSTEITSVASTDSATEAGGIMAWELKDASGVRYLADALLVTSGYKVFDAKRKEELGYGIYPGVITSIDMEKMLKEGKILNSVGDVPKKIVFLQCVGSRDEKSGNHYCSKVCCVTAVKQAIEVRKLLPEVEAYIFYMDLRMWGGGFEEMYRESQEKYDVRYVRGRISEAASTYDGKVQIKSEDTLVGLPLKMSADLLVLMVGMEPSEGTKKLTRQCNCADAYGFATTMNPHLRDNETAQPGLFVAGSCKRPMSLNDTLTDARSAALRIMEYVK
ncbi:MAG: CoB--CoM heterodisulfide reductase iron-sulfur subunit A family protein [Bacteroidales bacterium]|nr:CoB--CoM heterodisulfide reductase iron-sulfur subunit A family protein [Bacteroidales bacterium]